MTHGTRFARTLVLGFTIGMVSLLPLTASASEDGWAHRSPQLTASDGWSVRTQPAAVMDGWAARSSDAPHGAGVKDGFQVSLVELPQSEVIRDGWEVASIELPRAATAAQTAPAPDRPSITTADLIGLALATATVAAILTGMTMVFYRHRHHTV